MMRKYSLLGTLVDSAEALKLSALTQEDEWETLLAVLSRARSEWLESLLAGKEVGHVVGRCDLHDDLRTLRVDSGTLSDEIVLDERGQSGTNAGPARK